MKKVASALLMLLVLAGFLSLVIASDEENPVVRREKIQTEFDLEYEEIAKGLAPLNLSDYNKDFIARFVQRALFEKPFTKQKVDRVKITKEIVDSLLNGGAKDKPEEYRIEQFLRALTERVPESGFLSVSENEENYDKFQKESSISFDTDKAPGVIYVKFNVFKQEFDSANIFRRVMNNFLRAQSVTNEDMFPRKYIFDLRGCSGGDPTEAVRMAELFYMVKYDESPEQTSERRIRFITPPRLIYNKYLRPLDCLDGLYCGKSNVNFMNPLFLDKAEKERHEGFYMDSEGYMVGVHELIAWRDNEFSKLKQQYEEDKDLLKYTEALRKLEAEYAHAKIVLESEGQWVHYFFAMVKKDSLAEFKSFVYEFNSWLNSIQIVVLVDRETASAAELFVALLAENHDVTILGDRTHGKIVMGAIYPLVYDKSLVYDEESGSKKPLNQIRVLREFHPMLLRGHGFKKPDPNLLPLVGDVVPIGVMRLADGYWYNKKLNDDPRLRDIYGQGIIPDVDVSDLDKDKQLERAVEYLK